MSKGLIVYNDCEEGGDVFSSSKCGDIFFLLFAYTNDQMNLAIIQVNEMQMN